MPTGSGCDGAEIHHRPSPVAPTGRTEPTSDDAWLAHAEAGHPLGPFGHREHLRLTWLVLDREPSLPLAAERVSATIRRLAQAHGRPQRYNRTVTEAWVRIVAHCRAAGPAEPFEDMVARHPWLFDKRLLLRHYSSRVLASAQARRVWIAPDVQQIPA
jgi:hypothetical protein